METVLQPLEFVGNVDFFDKNKDQKLKLAFYADSFGNFYAAKYWRDDEDGLVHSTLCGVGIISDDEASSQILRECKGQLWNLIGATKTFNKDSNLYIYQDENRLLHLSREYPNGQIKIYKTEITTDASPIVD